jgi:hypothetical protein
MSSENCYWKKIKAQRNPAEKPSKLRLNAIGRWARVDLDKNSFESRSGIFFDITVGKIT